MHKATQGIKGTNVSPPSTVFHGVWSVNMAIQPNVMDRFFKLGSGPINSGRKIRLGLYPDRPGLLRYQSGRAGLLTYTVCDIDHRHARLMNTELRPAFATLTQWIPVVSSDTRKTWQDGDTAPLMEFTGLEFLVVDAINNSQEEVACLLWLVGRGRTLASKVRTVISVREHRCTH